MFVGQTATHKEKLLKLRADMMANEKGVKVNGMELTIPSDVFMKKLFRTEKLKE